MNLLVGSRIIRVSRLGVDYLSFSLSISSLNSINRLVSADDRGSVIYRYSTGDRSIISFMPCECFNSINREASADDRGSVIYSLLTGDRSILSFMPCECFNSINRVVSADDRGSVIYSISTGDRSILSFMTCDCFRFVCDKTYETAEQTKREFCRAESVTQNYLRHRALRPDPVRR